MVWTKYDQQAMDFMEDIYAACMKHGFVIVVEPPKAESVCLGDVEEVTREYVEYLERVATGADYKEFELKFRRIDD